MFFLPKITIGTFIVALISFYKPTDLSAGICFHHMKSEVTLAEAGGWFGKHSMGNAQEPSVINQIIER